MGRHLLRHPHFHGRAVQGKNTIQHWRNSLVRKCPFRTASLKKLGSPQMVYLSWVAGLPITISHVDWADEGPGLLGDVGMESTIHKS